MLYAEASKKCVAEAVSLPMRPILCPRGDQNAVDESKIYRRRVQHIFRRRVQVFRRRVRSFTADVVTLPMRPVTVSTMFGRVVGPLAVLVIACVLSQDSVFGQCTTRPCSGDDGDGGSLAATVSQLQESMERLQQQMTHQQVHLTTQEMKLTAQEKTIAFLRNASMSLLYHFVRISRSTDLPHISICLLLYSRRLCILILGT